jgi:hypothetical protein
MFKQIEGYEYEVSDHGEVRNMKTGRIMKQHLDKKGYNVISLKKDKVITFKVHRLVAIAFLENPNQYPQVDHKNCIKTDNHVENLQWVSQSQNQQNQPIRKDNKSGIKGVIKQGNKWRSYITIDSIRIWIGIFETIEEARDARIAKVQEVFTNAHITEQESNL